MLLWTGLMITSSSILRSRASTALLGLSSDSWERDSFSLGIRWDLKAEKEEEKTESPCRVWRAGAREEAYGPPITASAKEAVQGGRGEDAPLAFESADEFARCAYIDTFTQPLLSTAIADALWLLIYKLEHQWINETSSEDWLKLFCQLMQQNHHK